MRASDLYNEKELLLRLAEDDQTAFRELHNRYWNDLYHVALGFLKSPQWSQDIIQEVFLKIWQRRAQLGAVENFKAYLFIVARNELITAIKKDLQNERGKEQYRQILHQPLLLPDLPGTLKELQQHILKAISLLPEQQRIMLELARAEGLSHQEIAIKLGVARKTVANNITKALNHIRHYLLLNAGELVVFIMGILMAV